VDVELLEDMRDVGADRLLADEQPLGYLPVREAVGEQAQDVDLAPGQERGLGGRRDINTTRNSSRASRLTSWKTGCVRKMEHTSGWRGAIFPCRKMALRSVLAAT